MDIITDFLMVNQFMTESIQMKYVENANDSRIRNSTSEYLGNTTIRMCEQQLAYYDLHNEEGYWEFTCRERKYPEAVLTLGFIYLPAVNACGAFLGPTIAGILGFIWGIIMSVCGISFYFLFNGLIPRLATFYLIFFGIFLLATGLLKGKYQNLQCSINDF